ncbi:Reverse transcriptase (RNA-dependent DNA polymerase) [Popillia japonica]|uniref:Reverse transcriptase (RNA-dependent DNA polymerase) n=1 Tax=Popillia japonica TaxID=7064 RepID=A0AAW1HXL5_POPJA
MESRWNSARKLNGMQAELKIKKDCKPIFKKEGQVPFSIKQRIEQELDNLKEKRNFDKGETKLCGDYKGTVNPNLIVDSHPIPSVEELFADMAGGKQFSKIDLSQAYLQLELTPESRELLTLNTHMGLYQPTRLMYGIASAPAIWQRQIESILKYIPGVTVFLDDIKITGPDNDTHMKRLEQVLQTLDEHNVRVNFDKFTRNGEGELNLIEQLPVTAKELGEITERDGTVKILLQGLKNGRIVDAKFATRTEEWTNS